MLAFTAHDLQTWGPPVGAAIGLIVGLIVWQRNQSKKRE